MEGVNLWWVFVKMSGGGTHHGCYRAWQDVRMGKRGEGVLVCVLVCVLVLVELCTQVSRRRSSIHTLRGQKAGVQLLAEQVLLCVWT